MSELFVQGICKFFDKERGYGFIKMPDRALDVFVHANQLRKSGLEYALEEGQKLQFKVNKGEKGPFATEISRVNVDASS